MGLKRAGAVMSLSLDGAILRTGGGGLPSVMPREGGASINQQTNHDDL